MKSKALQILAYFKKNCKPLIQSPRPNRKAVAPSSLGLPLSATLGLLIENDYPTARRLRHLSIESKTTQPPCG